MEERRKSGRRLKMVRNLFSYLNRRNLFKRGRRKDEESYNIEPDRLNPKADPPIPPADSTRPSG